MATEKQIAANRRNALKSTGPRSPDGKRRSRVNAYRHGLSVSLAHLQEARADIAALAKLIADSPGAPVSVADATHLAVSDLDLQRVRRVKSSVIATAYEVERDRAGGQDDADRAPEALVTQSILKVLPELLRLERYARRAAASRDRTLRQIARGRETV